MKMSIWTRRNYFQISLGEFSSVTKKKLSRLINKPSWFFCHPKSLLSSKISAGDKFSFSW